MFTEQCGATSEISEGVGGCPHWSLFEYKVKLFLSAEANRLLFVSIGLWMQSDLFLVTQAVRKNRLQFISNLLFSCEDWFQKSQSDHNDGGSSACACWWWICARARYLSTQQQHATASILVVSGPFFLSFFLSTGRTSCCLFTEPRMSVRVLICRDWKP